MLKKFLNQLESTVQNFDPKATFETGFDRMGETAGSANAFALDAAEKAIDATVSVSQKWQDLSKDAINAGLKLSANQQELVFQSLTGIKSQLGMFRGNWANLMGSVSEAPVKVETKSYSKTAIKKMKEAELVAYAKSLGLDASTDDLKKDTVAKVIAKLGL